VQNTVRKTLYRRALADILSIAATPLIKISEDLILMLIIPGRSRAGSTGFMAQPSPANVPPVHPFWLDLRGAPV